MVLDILTHPGTGVVVGWFACTCTGHALDVIRKRAAEKQRKPWEDPTNRDELELWHATWVSPSISDTFYTWDDERGFVEREPWDVVSKILRWFDRPRQVRRDFSEMLGEPGSGLWSRMLAYRVREYGIWNALDYLDKATERHQEAERRRAESIRDHEDSDAFRSCTNFRQRYVTTYEDGFEYSTPRDSWVLHGVREVGTLDKDRNHVGSLQRRNEELDSILEELKKES